MRAWLKLVGSSDSTLSEHWTIESKDLLREVRFGTVHAPDPISRGDRLVYHAVGHHRIVAIVEVLDEDATVDRAPVDWEKRWPLILRVRPVLKVRRLSSAPLTSLVGTFELTHKSYLPLSVSQFMKAERLLKAAGAT